MFHDLLNLFYPRICHICESILVQNEHVICTNCIHELPVTNFSAHNENPVEKVFYGRVEIEQATSLLFFHKKSKVQKLIHQLKYRGYKEISTFLGTWMGDEIIEHGLMREVDAIIPVPLHRKKLKSRGFNQVENFGKEIANKLEVPYLDTVLLKKSSTTTQTLKARLSRWGNIEEAFVIANPHLIKDLHILLVDDIITTGATLEACSAALKEAGCLKISIASMAIAV
ncbi:ComF family protein [soil metagenome]